jgi:hypothetical protein
MRNIPAPPRSRYTRPRVLGGKCPPIYQFGYKNVMSMGRKTSLYVDALGDSILAARDGAVSEIKRHGRRSLIFRELIRRYDETWDGKTDIDAGVRWAHLLGAADRKERLLTKLLEFGLAHQIAIVDYIERYWAAKARHDTLPPLPGRTGTLGSVGARASER